MKQSNHQIHSPLLHRLIDEEPTLDYEHDPRRYIDFETLHQNVKDNLEHILNTRIGYFDSLKKYDELERSTLNYGIADFSQQYYSIKKHQRELCKNIQDVVTHFEPRLQKVRVHLLENDIELNRSFMIRIGGEINIKPEPQQAVFESSLDVMRYQFTFDEDNV